MKKQGLLFAAIVATLSIYTAAHTQENSPVTSNKDVFALSDNVVASQLEWIVDPLAQNLCRGYYKEDPIDYTHGKDSSLVDFSGSDSYLLKSGVSKMVGHVVITQYGKQATADTGYLYRDAEGNPTQFVLEGDMHLRAPTELIVAQSGTLQLPSRHWNIENGVFRDMLTSHNPSLIRQANVTTATETRVYQLSAWGRAKHIQQDKEKVTDLYNTTYTTCSPTCQAWHLYASHVQLNKNTGRGNATNAVFYIKRLPVFWLPYFDFPIDERRQTGFLNPTYGHSGDSGTFASTPFYWNIAPNYDTTVTPTYYSNRGWALQNAFRYLTPQGSSGTLSTTLVPHDTSFFAFRNSMDATYANDPTRANQLSQLDNASKERYYIDWTDTTYINPYWSAEWNYEYASDDYYMQDFSNNIEDLTEDQLLQQGLLNYNDENSAFALNVQRYQTLHPLNQADTDNQYSRMPQMDYTYYANAHPLGADIMMGSEFVNFNKNKNPFDISVASPTVGERTNLQPGISLPMQTSYGFVTPRMQYLVTGYHLNRPNPTMPSEPSRAIPVTDLDAGLYFNNTLHIFGNTYTQTVEPELYYLYVPNRNQTQFPLFDTVDNSSPTTFNYDDMFNYNRFSGLDRIGDANQVTMAVSTSYRDINTGNKKLTAGIGEIYYFRNREVLACLQDNTNNPDQPACSGGLPSYNTQRTSPIAGMFSYNLATNWSLNGNAAYNTHNNQMENQTVSFQYLSDYRHIFDISYTFARQADPDLSVSNLNPDSNRNNLQQTTVGFEWPVSPQWAALGQWNFNWSHEHLQAYLYGVEYDSCCWAFRAIISRVFTGLSPSFQNQYDTRFYLQFALKGFARLGTNDPGGLLTSSIAGYNDYFGEDY